MVNVNTLVRVASRLLLATLLLTACRKEGDRPRWDVDLLAPLVTSTLTIRDLVADSLITADSEGAVTLVYRSDLFTVDLDTLLSAPDTSFIYPYALPVTGPLNFPPGVNFFSQNDVQRFDLGDVALRRLVLREGRLDLRMKNMVASAVIGQLELPGVVLANGSSLLSTTVGAGSPQSPAYSTDMRDLAGSSFDLRGPQFNLVNTIQTILGAQLDPNGQGATVTDQDSVILEAKYSGLVPQYAKGYFGARTVEVGPDVTDLGLFNSIIGGTLDLDETTLRLRVENGIGVDIQVAMRSFQAVNTRTGVTVDLTHAIMNGPINLNRALDLGNGFVPSIYQNTLNNANSNIDQFIESMPDQVSYAMDMRLNPLGDVSSGNDFLYYESKIKASLELEVPLRIRAQGLTLETFSTPDLPGTAEEHGLREGTLNLFTTNGFPLVGQIQLAIVDAEGNVLSEVPVQGTIPAGPLGANGLVSAPASGVLTAYLAPHQVDLLYQGTRLRTRVVLSTSTQSMHLRILDTYALQVQITGSFNYLVNGDE
jgi:hypothetical protein